MRRDAAFLRLVLANGFALLVPKDRLRRAGPMGGVVIGGLVSRASDDAYGTQPRADRSLGYPLVMVRLVKSLIVLQPSEVPCSKSVKRSVWAEYRCCAVPTVIPVENRAPWPRFAVRSFRHSTVNSRRRVAQVIRFIPVFDADDTLVLIGSQTNWVPELFAALVGAPATFARACEYGRSFWILASRYKYMA